jgi:hypothetical protein
MRKRSARLLLVQAAHFLLQALGDGDEGGCLDLVDHEPCRREEIDYPFVARMFACVPTTRRPSSLSLYGQRRFSASFATASTSILCRTTSVLACNRTGIDAPPTTRNNVRRPRWR